MTPAAARWGGALAALLAILLVHGASPAQQPVTIDLPGGTFEAQADRFSSPAIDTIQMDGNVTFRSGPVLLQADRIIYDRATESGEAVGNVLYAQPSARIVGDRITFNLADETAEITNATGYLQDGFIFRARRVEQLDARRLRFEKGVFTACTQPTPYWAIHVSKGLIIKDRYVHLYNMALKTGPVPVFWSPYALFPIKPDRATGLLMPQFGVSNRLGNGLGNAFYWAIGRSQDATFYLDLYDKGSVGTGAEYRFVPNDRGSGQFDAYFISEKDIDDPPDDIERDRWNIRYRQRQALAGGGRFLANLEFVSDGDYFLDFSRDLDRGSDPSALSRAEYVINRGYSSWNLRAERREQFFSTSDVIQSRLPELELRSRSRRLGRSPFFLAFEGSASLLDRSAPGFPSGAYGRVDLFPTISAPFGRLPYLDITPTLRLRETYYTDSFDPNRPDRFGGGISREFVQFDTVLLGPRFSRIYSDADGNSRLKQIIEPRLTYVYQSTPDPEETAFVPRFDEIDVLPGDLNQVEYGLTTRFQARRPVRTPRRQATADPYWTGDLSAERRVTAPGVGGGAAGGPNGMGPPPDEDEEPVLSSPVEIASFFISQRLSFEDDLSFDREFIDTDGDGTEELVIVDQSAFSPVRVGGRYNPSPGSSVDMALSYDVLAKAVSDASVTAGLFSPRYGFLNASWFFRNGLDGRSLNSSTVKLSGGTSFWRNKISVAAAVNYDATLESLQDQRYRFGYDTQCCGFAFEVLRRDFVGTDQDEFRFVVNLKGLGNFLDIQGN